MLSKSDASSDGVGGFTVGLLVRQSEAKNIRRTILMDILKDIRVHFNVSVDSNRGRFDS